MLRGLTMKSRSLVRVEANANAKPAVDALILGVIRQTSPVAPTTAAESKLKRTESHRFTGSKGQLLYTNYIKR
jgi:hypothetical protein